MARRKGALNKQDPYNTTFTAIIQSRYRKKTAPDITDEHRITIPVSISRALDLKKGDTLTLKLYVNKEIVVSKNHEKQ
jgi:bifunctional DNA-binding transcriptional regulator/antitoxin component of YhaV-PrlF toxin-antitoxin module